MRPVLSKPDFYRRRGWEFGNHLMGWNTWEELLASGFNESIGIRNIVPGGPFVCPIAPPYWAEERNKVIAAGWAAETLRFGQSAPDERVTFQAEVCETHRGLEMRYTHGSGMTHRPAMKVAKNAHGLQALMLLRGNVEPSDVADIEALLELYPDHVIEFSTYAFPVGCIPGRTTLVWEVRRY